jgi:hypothetical protein
MEQVNSIDQLEKLDQWFCQLCEGLSYKPGNIFRIAGQYLKNWGITVTDDNKGWLEEMSLLSYKHEWKGASPSTLEAIRVAGTRAGLTLGNEELNEILAEMATDVLLGMDDGQRRFVIGDVGAGTGDTSMAILDDLSKTREGRELMRRCHFYLLEPAFDEMTRAKGALEGFRIGLEEFNFEIGHTMVNQTMETHFPMLPRGPMFDLLVSNAVFHHMTFPTYLGRIYEKLADDGVAVIGDWHTTIWQYPAFVVPILVDLGMDGQKLQEFKTRFEIREADRGQYEKQLKDHQVAANSAMYEFEGYLGQEFQSLKPEERLYFLEAHESLGDRLGKMRECGFCVDMSELKEKHKGFVRMQRNIKELYPESEMACVVAAGKVLEKRENVGMLVPVHGRGNGVRAQAKPKN